MFKWLLPWSPNLLGYCTWSGEADLPVVDELLGLFGISGLEHGLEVLQDVPPVGNLEEMKKNIVHTSSN